MTLIDTALQIRSLSTMFASLKDAADAFDRIGQMEQYEAELAAKIDAAKEAIDESVAALAENAKAAEKLKSDAKTEAEKIVAAAASAADAIIDEAKKQSAEDVRVALEALAEAQKQQEAIGVVSEDLKIEKAALEGELLALEAKISDAKAWLAKLASVEKVG
jgi:cell division septum initiation protein DivIVA